MPLQEVGVATIPLNAIVLVPLVGPKFEPLTVTVVPGPPKFGESDVIVGAAAKVRALLA